MQKNKGLRAIKILTAAAMLTALGAVIGIVCKNLFTFNIYYRITFENAPVILAGLLYGPAVGGAVGVCTDVVSCFLSSGAPNPVIMLGAFSVGALAGAVPFLIRKRCKLQFAVAVAVAHLVGQVAIKSVGKMHYFGMPWQGIFVGLGVSLVAGVLEFLLINWLLSVKGLENIMGGRAKK